MNVSSIVKPGAKISNVIDEVHELTKGYCKNDFVLVIGGTNNVDNTGEKSILGEFHVLIEKTRKTNLIFATLPMIHDNPKLDSKINWINHKLTEKMKKI